MLLSLILFGSRARGDHRLTSDVDLLGVTDGGPIREELTSRGASFYQYPLELLQTKSEAGDLFVLHLALEGKILHDTAGLFADVSQRFRYKASYDTDLREASGIIWYLLDRPAIMNSRLARKRLVWALRTILIARSAEMKTPAFSSAALAEFAANEDLKAALDRRYTVPIDVLCELSDKVASVFGVSRTELDWPMETSGQRDALRKLGGVATATADGWERGRKKNGSSDQTATKVFYV